MRPFVPEASEIDSNWFSQWGNQFGAPVLATEMAKNPRTADRVVMSVLDSMQIDVRTRFSEEETIPVAQYIEGKERLVTLCGLVLHGDIIRNQVAKSDFDLVIRFFDLEDLKLAASFPELCGNKSEFGFDINKLPELVKQSGSSCVEIWKQCLSRQMSLRLQLLESEETGSDNRQELSVELCKKIVLAVSQKLCGLPYAKAA